MNLSAEQKTIVNCGIFKLERVSSDNNSTTGSIGCIKQDATTVCYSEANDLSIVCSSPADSDPKTLTVCQKDIFGPHTIDSSE